MFNRIGSHLYGRLHISSGSDATIPQSSPDTNSPKIFSCRLLVHLCEPGEKLVEAWRELQSQAMEGNPVGNYRPGIRQASASRTIKIVKLTTLAIFVSVTFFLIAKPVGSQIFRFLGFDRQIENNDAKM